MEVIKNQIKFFIERGNYMKKVICLFSAFLLLLSIPSYNKTYSAQPTDNDFLSLQEYNTEYSNGENPLKIDSSLTTQNAPDICAISPIRKQTKSIILANQRVQVGTITLQYQTDIQGGRPQFLYDTCADCQGSCQ